MSFTGSPRIRKRDFNKNIPTVLYVTRKLVKYLQLGFLKLYLFQLRVNRPIDSCDLAPTLLGLKIRCGFYLLVMKKNLKPSDTTFMD